MQSVEPTRRLLLLVGTMNAGGAERVAATLANAWVAQGYEVRLVMTHLGVEKSFYPLDARVQCVPLKQWVQQSVWRPTLWAKWQALRAVYADFDPDVVLSFLTNVNINVLWALRHVEAPIVVCERTHPLLSRSAGRGLKLLRRYLYPRAARIVMQTDSSAQAMHTALARPTPLAVIPNPIAPQLWSLPAATEVAPSTPPQVVALGRLTAIKGYDRLIRAFAALPADYHTWQLCFYGDGPQKSQLQALAQQCGVAERVHFKGRTEHPWENLVRGQLFVLCSEYEGFPNALLEAMALGLPCIALDCPSGPAELSEQGRVARLLPAQASTEQLSQAMAELMGDPKARQVLGRQARDSVRQRYQLEAVLSLWAQLFAQLERRPHS